MIDAAMEISYLGHACFKIKTKTGTVVMDPFGKMTGFSMPSVSADVVTVSHSHEDHDATSAVSGTARREKPFIINEPGEYEVEGISIFGYKTFHDNKEGKERGDNNVFIVQAEDLRVLHLGDLGHMPEEKLIGELDGVDILMIPTGGIFTIGSQEAVKVAEAIDPYYVLPMHYKTDKHQMETYGELEGVESFIKNYGHNEKSVKSLNVSKLSLPQDVTEVITFEGMK